MQFWGGKEIWIDQARAIAIICMVLCHTNDIMGCNFVFYKLVGIFFMPLFFFISGCLSKDNMTIRKLTSRIIGRLLIPYFVWAIIMQMAINKAFIYACINGDIVIVEKHILNRFISDEDYIINAIAIPMMLSISIFVSNLLIKPINKYCPIIVGNKKLNF